MVKTSIFVNPPLEYHLNLYSHINLTRTMPKGCHRSKILVDVVVEHAVLARSGRPGSPKGGGVTSGAQKSTAAAEATSYIFVRRNSYLVTKGTPSCSREKTSRGKRYETKQHSCILPSWMHVKHSSSSPKKYR